MDDIQWPNAGRNRDALVKLALAHDVGVVYAHRAMADCDILARMFTRLKENGVDLQELFQRAVEPRQVYVAQVPFQMNDKVKEAGFRWNREGKRWERKMTQQECDGLSFKAVPAEKLEELIKRGRLFCSPRCSTLTRRSEPDPSTAPTSSPSMLDTAWLAGLYEGEGSCSGASAGFRIYIGQKDPWVLLRCKNLFGGKIWNSKRRQMHHWYVGGPRARGIAHTIFSFLSPRRKKQLLESIR
jgi:hypothetical protein